MGVYADNIRNVQDVAVDLYVSGLIDPLQEQLVVTGEALAQSRADEEQALATASQVEAENAVLRAQIAELEARATWRLIEDVDLSDSTGWVSETGKPNNAEGYDLPRNVIFGPDGLRLLGKREAYNGYEFTSADTKGTGHPVPNHCRVEVIGRAVHEVGLWPCLLWLRPLTGSDGEIDLMENFGGQPRVSATLHNEYGTNHKMIHGNLPWPSDPAGMHTYVMEKTPGRILVTCDGLTLLDAGPDDAPAGFDWTRIFETDRQWYPRVTMQVSAPGKATGVPTDDFREADLLVTALRIYAPA